LVWGCMYGTMWDLHLFTLETALALREFSSTARRDVSLFPESTFLGNSGGTILLARCRDDTYRDLLYHCNPIVLRPRDRYKHSVLGFFWSLLDPLLLVLVFTFVFPYRRLLPTGAKRSPCSRSSSVGSFTLELVRRCCLLQGIFTGKHSQQQSPDKRSTSPRMLPVGGCISGRDRSFLLTPSAALFITDIAPGPGAAIARFVLARCASTLRFIILPVIVDRNAGC